MEYFEELMNEESKRMNGGQLVNHEGQEDVRASTKSGKTAGQDTIGRCP